MGLLEITLIGVGLAMDAFAVSVCKGISIKKLNYKDVLIIALYFGIFQAIMPLIGYLFGTTFSKFVSYIDHWIVFVLLSIIGGKMILDSVKDEEGKGDDKINFKTMIILALATSIDALAIGITFAFFEINILKAILVIGVVTFLLSALGVKIGNKFGDKFGKKAEIAGGIILIIIGLKILLEHLGILALG